MNMLHNGNIWIRYEMFCDVGKQKIDIMIIYKGRW